MVAILSCRAPITKAWTFLTSGVSGAFHFGSSCCHKKGGPLSHWESTRSCGETRRKDSSAGFCLPQCISTDQGCCCFVLLLWVGHENVQASGIVLDIAEDHLTICVEHLGNLVELKLLLQQGADPYVEQGCQQLESRDRNRFQWSYLSLAHDEAAVDLTSVICKTQVRTLALSMVARVRKVVELYGTWVFRMDVACRTSGSSVSPGDVGCFSIFPNYGTMVQVLDRPSGIYLGRDLEEFVFQSGSPVLRIPEGHIQNWRLIPRRVKGLSCRTIRNWEVSDSTHHWMPSARSIGRTSLWMSRSLTSFTLS